MEGISHMRTSFTKRFAKNRFLSGLAATGVAALILTGCSAAATETAPTSGESEAAVVEETVAVSLILKNLTNPFFVAMEAGAKEKAAEIGVELTVGAAKEEGDDQGQIDLIEAAIAQGQAGILITPMSTNVNAAITKAPKPVSSSSRWTLPPNLQTLSARLSQLTTASQARQLVSGQRASLMVKKPSSRSSLSSMTA